jgi:lipid-A-disaccharide synthase
MAQAPGLSDELFLALTKRWPSNFSLSKNTYHLLSRAKYAVVCSGTATLETALFDVPQIVFYRTSLLNYLLAKWLLKVRCISLVNLILQKPFVKEVIHPLKQRWALQKSFAQMIGKDNREYFKGGYEELRSKLGSKDTPKECSKFIFNV